MYNASVFFSSLIAADVAVHQLSKWFNENVDILKKRLFWQSPKINLEFSCCIRRLIINILAIDEELNALAGAIV